MKSMRALNFTVHNLTNEQKLGGGIEPSEYVKEEIKKITNFSELDEIECFEERAKKLVGLMLSSSEDIFGDPLTHHEYNDKELCVMIGSGPPAFTYFLVKEMKSEGITPCFSHSKRECIEVHNADGTVSKNYVFKHEGFYTL